MLPITVLIAFIYSGPLLPPGADQIIARVIESEVPELVKGETGVAKSNGVNIWYEAIAPAGKPKADILLIMGMGAGALTWPEYFFKPLVDSGYRVIRFDHRGVGMSDWIVDWNRKKPYTLEDMARDSLSVLDDLGIRKAHIVGLSMGGMIAQRIAISYPGRVMTLTSFSSCGDCGDPDMPEPGLSFGMNVVRLILRYGLIRNEKNAARFSVGVMQLFKGDGLYAVDVRGISEGTLYELRKRHGFNYRVVWQHLNAVEASGSRYPELERIQTPTLVIHGVADPLLSLEHAKKYAPMIPKARTLWIEGMGHDFPRAHTPNIVEGILDHIQRFERASN